MPCLVSHEGMLHLVSHWGIEVMHVYLVSD